MFNRTLLIIFLLSIASLLPAQQVSKQPNIIVIIADDLGWADLQCYGSTFYETPVLNKLATQGIQFTNGYASCPVCSPTRASLLTGKYPVKTGVTDWIKGRQAGGIAKPYEKLIAKPIQNQLALEEQTIAELAIQNGYKTFYAGKWHLGESEQYWPEAQGFPINKGGFSSGSPSGFKNDTTGGYFPPYKNPRLTDGPAGEYLTDRLTNETLQFLDQNHKAPFLVTYALYAVHNPLQTPKPLIKKYEEKQKMLGSKTPFRKDEAWMKNENGWRQRTVQNNPIYAAMIENMDSNIGRILSKLEQLGIADNTIILFTSDNGGLSTAEGSPTVNGPLRGGKGWLYEGGIKVPVIMRWPAKIKANQVSPVPVNTVDFFPTFATAMNAAYRKSETLDGENILSLISKPRKANKRALYWHYPHYSNQGGRPGSAIVKGNYKLIYNYEDSTTELYDLKKDVGEINNLSILNKKLEKELKSQLFQWLQKVKAQTPDNNPVFNPGYKPIAKKGQDDE